MGFFDAFRKKQSGSNIENNSNKKDSLYLPSQCKRLCSISKDNVGVERIVGYKIKRGFETGYDSYSIFLNIEDGAMFFVHGTLEHVGAAYDIQVQYAATISFENVKSLLLYEVDYYKGLVERWEQNNDTDRANSCKKHVQELETIININENDWIELTNL